MIEVALFAAIGFVLDEFQGAIAVSFPNGGSIGVAMVAVLIVAYRRGCLPGVLTGLIIGLFDLGTKAYVLHPLQVMCDYIFPYALVGLSGLFKPLFEKADSRKQKVLWLIIGTTIGGLLKLCSHFVAGVVWWGDPEYFAWGLNNWNVYLYSFVYNLAFTLPCIILSGALLVVLYFRAPIIFEAGSRQISESTKPSQKSTELVTTFSLLAVGLFLFIFFLISYINSFYWKESSSKYYFNQDSMVNFITGIAIILECVNLFILIKKGKYHFRFALIFIDIILALHMVYTLSHIIAMYIDQEPENYYWIWFGLTTLVFILSTIVLIKEKKNRSSSNL